MRAKTYCAQLSLRDVGPKVYEQMFQSALEKVVRDSKINTKGNIFHKSIQLLAFAAEVIARTPTELRQAFWSEEKEVFKMEQKINGNKTKCIPCCK
ncbi:hypothetical protein TNCV_2751201 [Trichonephila clavipes]|nr:hypothetical protein TNCV_2751201 [Trichonephila clavipes]